MTNHPAQTELVCTTCGKALAAPAGQAPEAFVDEESARCARLREIVQQRRALAARMQSGIAGVVGSDSADTVDLIAQRKSLAQLDATLETQAQALGAMMAHVPEEQTEP